MKMEPIANGSSSLKYNIKEESTSSEVVQQNSLSFIKTEPIDSDPSTCNDNVEEESMYSDKAKQRLKNAFSYCQSLLLLENLIAEQASTEISPEAKLMGEEIYERILDMLSDKIIIHDEELILPHEEDEQNLYHQTDDVVTGSDPDYEPLEEEARTMTHIPLEIKKKIVKLARDNPRWKLSTLQRNGAHCLKSMNYIKQWEEDIKNGGTTKEKYAAIDSYTYDRFVKARAKNEQVTTKKLQEWALSAADQFQSSTFAFRASPSWIMRFKRKHGIRQKDTLSYISRQDKKK